MFGKGVNLESGLRIEIDLGDRFSSVGELQKECNSLLDKAKEWEETRLDIYRCAKDVREVVTAMVDTFNNGTFDETEVYNSKMRVCEAAINLEYVLSRFCPELRDRYLKRVQVTELHSEVLGYINKLNLNEEIQTIEGMTALSHMLSSFSELSKLKLRSLNVIFDMNEEEEELLKMCKIDVEGVKDVFRKSEVSFV